MRKVFIDCRGIEDPARVGYDERVSNHIGYHPDICEQLARSNEFLEDLFTKVLDEIHTHFANPDPMREELCVVFFCNKADIVLLLPAIKLKLI